VIRIRHSDLPSGLHARAEAQGRDTVITLLPGLAAADRRAALLRLRRSGAMGYGPRLPAAAVAAAMALDRAVAFSRHCAEAVRAHPYLVLPPTIIAVTTGLAALAAATTIAMRPPGGGAPGPGPGGSVVAPASPGRPAPSPGASRSARPHRVGGASHSGRPSRSPRPASSPGRSSPLSPSPSSSSSGPAPPSPPPSASSPTPEPSGSGSPEPSPSPTASGPCLDIGPLGICLSG
jgi:hypothetical protein